VKNWVSGEHRTFFSYDIRSYFSAFTAGWLLKNVKYPVISRKIQFSTVGEWLLGSGK
jgi:hypothetical protein